MVAQKKQTDKPKKPIVVGQTQTVTITVTTHADGREDVHVKGPRNRCDTLRILANALYSTAGHIEGKLVELAEEVADHRTSKLILPNKGLSIVT